MKDSQTKENKNEKIEDSVAENATLENLLEKCKRISDKERESGFERLRDYLDGKREDWRRDSDSDN